MATSVTRSSFTTRHQTCKTKTDFFWSQTGLVLRPTVWDQLSLPPPASLAPIKSRMETVWRQSGTSLTGLSWKWPINESSSSPSSSDLPKLNWRAAPVSVVVVGVLVEVRRHPAVDRVSDELLGGDEDGEADQYRDGRAMVHSVAVVVVASRFGVGHRVQAHRLKQVVHRPAVFPSSSFWPQRR